MNSYHTHTPHKSNKYISDFEIEGNFHIHVHLHIQNLTNCLF